MSDYCYDCTERLFGDGNDNDFVAEDGDIFHVLCEGCGQITVNKHGKRIHVLENKTVDFLYDWIYPESIYFLPSGFKDRVIMVSENPYEGSSSKTITKQEKEEIIQRLKGEYD